jgi:hypothetical protein
MPLWLHATLCVIVPAVWGVAMVQLFDFLDRRRPRRRPAEDDVPPIDYSI